MAVEQALAQFKETEGGESFRLQNSKLLKVELAGEEIQTKLGSMVAYQGDVHFEHAGSGGLSRMLKKAVTNEGTQLMKVTGTGEVFLADTAQEIQLLQLAGERITVNGPHVLAFESGIDWDIKRVEGASGALRAASTTWSSRDRHRGAGDRRAAGDDRARRHGDFADPQAAITWSEGVTSSIITGGPSVTSATVRLPEKFPVVEAARQRPGRALHPLDVPVIRSRTRAREGH